jgi:hypothetical protein
VWKNGDQSIHFESSARSISRFLTPVNAGVGSEVKSTFMLRERASSSESSGRFCAATYASRTDACLAAFSAR